MLTGANQEHGANGPHDSRQGGAPGFGALPVRAGMGMPGGGPPDAGPLAPHGGRGFGIGRGRALKGGLLSLLCGARPSVRQACRCARWLSHDAVVQLHLRNKWVAGVTQAQRNSSLA